MAKNFRLNIKTLRLLFDYNSFSHSKKLEQLVQESLERTEARSHLAGTHKAFQRTAVKTSAPLELNSLETLCAAGLSGKLEIPPNLRH